MTCRSNWISFYRMAVALVGVASQSPSSLQCSISDLGQTHRLRLLRVDPPTPESQKLRHRPQHLACFGLKKFDSPTLNGAPWAPVAQLDRATAF